MKAPGKDIWVWIIALVVLVTLFGCERSGSSLAFQYQTPENPVQEKFSQQPVTRELPLLISYHLDSLATGADVDSFKRRFSPLHQEFIFALNRMDPQRLSIGDKLIIPDTLTENFLNYSPFPESFEMLEFIPKAILISRRIQGFALYENGKLLRWGPVSSGKKSTPTPAGLFYGNFKHKRKISTVNSSWIMPYYFNIMNYEGIGVHQYALPGYPASHACVRLRNNDALAIYNWADQWQLDQSGQEVKRNGTPFMIFGDYDFERPVPWLELAENPNVNFLKADEMEVLRGYVNEYQKDVRNFDPLVPARELSVPRVGLETIR